MSETFRHYAVSYWYTPSRGGRAVRRAEVVLRADVPIPATASEWLDAVRTHRRPKMFSVGQNPEFISARPDTRW